MNRFHADLLDVLSFDAFNVNVLEFLISDKLDVVNE